MKIPWIIDPEGPGGPAVSTNSWAAFGKEIEMRDNFEFDAVLTLEWMSWSNSSSVCWSDDSGIMYSMFITDFEKMLLSGQSIYNKTVAGRWTFIKRGQRYGLRSVDAPK
jgi:hypothetical protein